MTAGACNSFQIGVLCMVSDLLHQISSYPRFPSPTPFIVKPLLKVSRVLFLPIPNLLSQSPSPCFPLPAVQPQPAQPIPN